MKVKCPLITIFLLTFSFVLVAQEAVQFTPNDLQNISKRWSKYHPRAEVFLHEGDTLIGQPVHFDMHELHLFPSDSLPINLEGKLISIPFADINHVSLERGGPVTPGLTTGIVIGIAAGIGIGAVLGSPGAALILGNLMGVGGGMVGKVVQRSSTSAELELKSYNLNYGEELKKLHEWSVFKDSLLFTSDLNLLPVYSRAMQRLYPQKHLRITLGLNWGLNSLESDMSDALSSSGLPPWEYFEHSSRGYEYLDLSWRFNYHWILGFGIMSNSDFLAYAESYSANEDGTGYLNYTYYMDLNDFRFYMEYAISPVNRFLTERTELLLGGGLIISRPSTNFWYNHETDPSTGDWDSASSYGTYTLLGFQARASYNVYLFRNFSLSGGAELNLYQNMKMPAVELSSGETVLDAHTLNYSTVRFKLGAHLYF